MNNKIDILALINKNDWNKILEYLKTDKINPNTSLSNGNYLSHIAALNNQRDIIDFYSDKDMLNKNNDDGVNSYHIMAKYGYTDILKRSIIKDKKSINLTDINDNTILHYLVENKDDCFEWLIKNIKDIDYNTVNTDGDTILNKCIKYTNDINDIFYNRIKLLLSKDKLNINYPNTNYPIMDAITQKKSYVANLLIKEGCDVNIKDSNYITPFLLSVYNELDSTVQLLIDNGADINYIGAEGDNNPLSLMLLRGNDKISDILLENGFNTKNYNRDMNTPLHIAFNSKNNLKPTIVSKLLFYGDLNIQNMNGETPLHLFLKNYDWRNYDKILENKKLDIFIKDHNNKTPLDYVSNKNLIMFLNLVTNSFLQNSKYDKKCNDTKDLKCFNKTKEYILKNKMSYIDNIDTELDNEIKLITSPDISKGRFNSDVLHNVIYTTIILERNSNLGLPFQYYNKEKAATIQMLLETTNFLYGKAEEVIMSELISVYHEYFFELAPYLIIWNGKNLYYVDKYIDFYSQKFLNSDKIRFIFYKLTLITSATGTHANIIIFDKETGILERFEPYGIIPYLDNIELDEMIKDKIGGFLNKYLNKNNKKLIYYSPRELFDGVSFQIISNDTSSQVRKMGDPTGFCLAWTLWYLEMRIKNPNINPKTLIKKSLNKIKNNSSKKYRNQIFIDFIRNYAGSLDDEKNKILLSAGISKDQLYNVQFSNEDNLNIFNEVIKRITFSVVERL